jgi:hypothetical protein
MLRSAENTLGLEPQAPELLALRDIYLEPWERLAPRSVLLAAWTLAQQVGMVCRTLTWHRVVTSLGEPYRSQNAGAVPGWLGEYLEAVSA